MGFEPSSHAVSVPTALLHVTSDHMLPQQQPYGIKRRTGNVDVTYLIWCAWYYRRCDTSQHHHWDALVRPLWFDSYLYFWLQNDHTYCTQWRNAVKHVRVHSNNFLSWNENMSCSKTVVFWNLTRFSSSAQVYPTWNTIASTSLWNWVNPRLKVLMRWGDGEATRWCRKTQCVGENGAKKGWTGWKRFTLGKINKKKFFVSYLKLQRFFEIK